MNNPLYYQWLDALAQRDYAMLFITLAANAAIGGWLLVREHRRLRRMFIYSAIGFYYVSLVILVYHR